MNIINKFNKLFFKEISSDLKRFEDVDRTSMFTPFLFIISFSGFILGVTSHPEGSSISTIILINSIMFCMLTMIVFIGISSFIRGIFLFLHIIFPKREYRVNLINKYIDELEDELVLEENERFLKLYPKYEDLEQWINKNVSSSRAIKNYVYMNSKKDNRVENILGYKIELIDWIMNIPLDNLDDNNKFLILKQANYTSSYIYDYSDCYDNCYTKNINYSFSNYKEKELVRLFESVYSSHEYVKKIRKHCGEFRKEKFPIFKTMQDLFYFLDNYLYDFPENIFLKNKENIDGELVIPIDSFNKLHEYADYFQNCIKTYDSEIVEGKSFFFVLKRKKKSIIFHVNKDCKFISAKYKLNDELSQKDFCIVYSIIKQLKN